MWTFSRIEGQTVPEGRVRRWRIVVAEWIFGEHGSAKSSEIGQVHVFTVPELDLKCGALETVVTALVESEVTEFRAPLLVIESIRVKPKYRGRGLATLVAGEAFRWFDGLVNLAALAVTKKPKYRPAAIRIVEKLGFRQLKDDVWVREVP
jgi:GNAT superfamily N-acetyltransferase